MTYQKASVATSFCPENKFSEEKMQKKIHELKMTFKEKENFLNNMNSEISSINCFS